MNFVNLKRVLADVSRNRRLLYNNVPLFRGIMTGTLKDKESGEEQAYFREQDLKVLRQIRSNIDRIVGLPDDSPEKRALLKITGKFSVVRLNRYS